MRDRGLLWVVVEVQAGIPVQAAVFRQRAEAEEVERSIRARLSLDEDETAVFAARVTRPSRRRLGLGRRGARDLLGSDRDDLHTRS